MSANNKNVSFLDELKRRNVYRVGLAYVVLTWLVLQVIDTLGQGFNLAFHLSREFPVFSLGEKISEFRQLLCLSDEGMKWIGPGL